MTSVFGMSFGELLILGVIAIVVVGPRRLPSLMRSTAQLIGRLRRMAVELREESGIDQLLEAEGIHKEIETFRRLAAGEILADEAPGTEVAPRRGHEYPRAGCDSYGAVPEDLVPYLPAPDSAPPAPSSPADPKPT